MSKNLTALSLTVRMSDGTEHILAFNDQKPSKSGKPNQYAGGKVVTKDGEKFQLGANFTKVVKA
jgi:hypothetical protein